MVESSLVVSLPRDHTNVVSSPTFEISLLFPRSLYIFVSPLVVLSVCLLRLVPDSVTGVLDRVDLHFLPLTPNHNTSDQGRATEWTTEQRFAHVIEFDQAVQRSLLPSSISCQIRRSVRGPHYFPRLPLARSSAFALLLLTSAGCYTRADESPRPCWRGHRHSFTGKWPILRSSPP